MTTAKTNAAADAAADTAQYNTFTSAGATIDRATNENIIFRWRTTYEKSVAVPYNHLVSLSVLLRRAEVRRATSSPINHDLRGKIINWLALNAPLRQL